MAKVKLKETRQEAITRLSVFFIVSIIILAVSITYFISVGTLWPLSSGVFFPLLLIGALIAIWTNCRKRIRKRWSSYKDKERMLAIIGKLYSWLIPALGTAMAVVVVTYPASSLSLKAPIYLMTLIPVGTLVLAWIFQENMGTLPNRSYLKFIFSIAAILLIPTILNLFQLSVPPAENEGKGQFRESFILLTLLAITSIIASYGADRMWQWVEEPRYSSNFLDSLRGFVGKFWDKFHQHRKLIWQKLVRTMQNKLGEKSSKILSHFPLCENGSKDRVNKNNEPQYLLTRRMVQLKRDEEDRELLKKREEEDLAQSQRRWREDQSLLNVRAQEDKELEEWARKERYDDGITPFYT